jgi:hypothetical protein
MCDILLPQHRFLAANDAGEGKYWHAHSEPFQLQRLFGFHIKTCEAIHAVRKIDERIIPQRDHGSRQRGRTEASANRQYSDVLSPGQTYPNIGVESGRGHTLQNGGGHSRYLKPYAFLDERVNKFSERRKFSCIRQRSSGVAARLLANRIFS